MSTELYKGFQRAHQATMNASWTFYARSGWSALIMEQVKDGRLFNRLGAQGGQCWHKDLPTTQKWNQYHKDNPTSRWRR